jgi:hypothetical protein
MTKYRVVKKTKTHGDSVSICYLIQRKVFIWTWETVDIMYDEEKATSFCKLLMSTPMVTKEVIYSPKSKK